MTDPIQKETTMSEDVYYKLGERLNEYPVKMPLVDAFLDILREYYTEDQAALGAAIPKGAHLAPDLAKQLGRDEQELVAALETMADSGLIFTGKNDAGETEYSVMPFVPGVWELQLMKGTDTEHDRKTARMMKDFGQDLEGLLIETMKDPEMAKQFVPEAAARTITVEKELPSGKEIYPFENLAELVENEKSFAAGVCYCRHHAYLVDEPCKVEGVPERSCLSFGKVADFVVDRGFGEPVSKEECLQILEATEKAGLVHNANNNVGGLVFVCNCCGCCCGFLKMLRDHDIKAMLALSNFQVAVDEDTCTGCGDCIDRCQMEALRLEGEVVTVKLEHCVGCGNCVSACPTESLSMERRSDTRPPEIEASFGGASG
jgi:NAD-dependent dihydropyrimidine dehydrogenase PreA subunit